MRRSDSMSDIKLTSTKVLAIALLSGAFLVEMVGS